MHFSRRQLMGAAAASTIVGWSGGDARAAARFLYVAPEGSGDGTSWDTAAPLADLSRLIRRVGGGGEILIAADRGEYRLHEEIVVDAAGIENAPVGIRGVDSHTLAPLAALIRGTRGPNHTGSEGFRLVRGAGHLRFAQLDFRDMGNGCFRVGAPVKGLAVEDCRFDNIYRFLENTITGDEQDASLQNFSVARCSGFRAERGFSRVRYGSSDGVFEDCTAHGLANMGGDLPAGCALDDRAARIIYRRCIMEGFQQLHGGHYWNGDGFSDEAGNEAIRYEQCQARGSTDGGFDCKSRELVLQGCLAEDNKRNFRIWSARATLANCTSRAPHFRGAGEESADPCHIWIGGSEQAEIQVTDLVVFDTDAPNIFDVANAHARVELRGCTIESPRTNWGAASVRRGPNNVVIISARG